MSTSFALRPEDRAAMGIKVADDRLTIWATAPARLMGTMYIVLGGALLVAGATSAWPLALIGTVVVGIGWRSVAARLVAGRDTLRVRNHWRSFEVSWVDVD